MIFSDTVKYPSLFLLILLVTACDTSPTKQFESNAANAIAAAKVAHRRAIKEKYEWRDTGKLIKNAEKSLAKGNAIRATKLANKARRQAENAVKQKYNELKRLKHMLNGSPDKPDTSSYSQNEQIVATN